jgi:isoquinoline 1-oxidoreductase beta subunit
MAGAAAKFMLVGAAAASWGVEASQCTVSNGIITGPDGQSVHFGEVATTAANIEVPQEVPLKDPKDYKIIGQDKSNVDLKQIITGKALFGIDTKREGMVYATMMRPPAFGQKLINFDATAAKAVNGVSDVIQIGDKIAVIANNTWAAIKAKKTITAEWSSDNGLDNSADHDKKMLELAYQADEEPRRKDGDIATAFSNADFVLEKVYEAPFLPHNCLEPMNFFASVTDSAVELYGPIQTPQGTRGRIAKAINRDEKEITLGMSRMGGGFGRRLYGDFAEEAALISDAIRKPVQLQFTREDDMTAGTYRPASKYKIKASVKDGKVTGYQLTEVAVNANMYGLIPNFFPAFAIDNYQVDDHQLKSDITVGAWRAPYTNFLAFAEQSFFDELAEKMNVDAVQLRLDLLENAKKHTDNPDLQWSPERMQETIKLAADKGGWGKEENGVYKGFSAYYSHNTHVAEVAHVIMKDGVPTVDKVVCAIDCGIVVNPIAAKNQVEGGVVDGIGHAMYGDLTFKNGKPSADNFHQFRLIRHQEAPKVEVHFVQNTLSPTGLGEPSLPPAGGAVSNALYKATGKRIYKQPFIKESDLLG